MMALDFMKKAPGIGLDLLIEVFPMFFPLALQFTLPIAMLVAVVLTFSRMQSDGELTALSASGVSALRVVWPVLAAASLIAILSLVLVDIATPHAASRLRDAKRNVAEKMQTSFRSGLRDIPMPGGPRISFEGYDRGTFEDVMVEFASASDPARVVRARGGTLEITDDGKVRFELSPLYAMFPARDGKGRSVLSVESIAGQVPISAIAKGNTKRKRTALAAWELAHVWNRQIPDKLYRFGAVDAAEELTRRSAMAGSVFFFALVGISMGVLAGRRAKVAAVIVACGPVIVAYFPLLIVGSNLSKTGTLPPYLALWMGNIVFAIVGVVMLFKVVRR